MGTRAHANGRYAALLLAGWTACAHANHEAGRAVTDADRARVEAWYDSKARGVLETPPPSPRWGDRWLFVNGGEVDLEAFTKCVTAPGHFTLGPDSRPHYGKPHVESVCCADRTIFIDSAGQPCASWSMPGRCQHEEWLEMMLTDDGRLLALAARAPACADEPATTPLELDDERRDAPPIGERAASAIPLTARVRQVQHDMSLKTR